jgi:hypothetical protein
MNRQSIEYIRPQDPLFSRDNNPAFMETVVLLPMYANAARSWRYSHRRLGVEYRFST